MSWKNAAWMTTMVLLTLTGCGTDDRPAPPDVSDIPVTVQIRRFEQDLFRIDTTRLAAELAALEAEYPAFSPIFFDFILRSRDSLVAPQGHAAYVAGFIHHPTVRRLYDTTQVVYADLSDIEAEFRQALQFFRYYFPEEPVPDLTTFISEYSLAAFIYGPGNSLAVGLDFFLGEDYPYQAYNPMNPSFSSYLTRTFNRDHLVAKTLQPLVDQLAGEPGGERLLDLMIHNGKKLYLLDHLLPYAPDSVVLELPPAKVQWLEDNELEMWAYFIKEDLLYNSDYQAIRKLVEYSPNSPGMPPEAPGRTANWVGRQIVKAYMKQFPETTMPELIDLRDAQQLLDASRYKPRR